MVYLIHTTRYKLTFILHPVTKNKLETSMWRIKLESESNIEFCERMDYIKFIQLLYSAEYIITDGGSNQEGWQGVCSAGYRWLRVWVMVWMV